MPESSERIENQRSAEQKNIQWMAYNPQQIEPKWQDIWEKAEIYTTGEASGRPKYYCLDFFPYPSGEGLHVGHCRNYVPTDVISRFKRMQGYNVLHPMGWDAFGEPAEQFAITHGVHPRVTTDRNTANFRRQMKLIGTSYDWSREIDSSDPAFYRWTQWFFLLLYKRGLAYRDTNWQWWCPTCQTTLSSHEVVGGICWRGHSGVTKREIPAWYFKITAYADQLMFDLNTIDWPERIKTLQRNWIGKSEGCEIQFMSESGEVVPVFTTRPDTLFGVTFLVLAPEHPLVEKLTTPERREQVMAYIAQATRRSEIERLSEALEKTGVFSGSYIVNPLNGERVQVWIADYVLPTYGTGAVMGVPAHDQRDFIFAQKYNLPVKFVIAPPGYDGQALNEAYTGNGTMINSGPFDGVPSEIGAREICDYIEKNGLGRRTVNYRMHDWLISRQRYWGTPIPIIYCPTCGVVPVPEDQLPVLLPSMENFEPDGSGQSPLARVPEFVNTSCPVCGEPARRETDTMGGFACSSWYFLRFTSPHYNAGPFEPVAMRYWMPVDLYVGGAEHAVLHLLYARFWVKVMADAGLVPFREPFSKLMNQGSLLASDGYRMSKSRGNVITPDSIVEEYGADTLRIYELFMAPFDQDASWSTEGIMGVKRFLDRIWELFRETYFESARATETDINLLRLTSKTIRRMSETIEGFKFNIMVAVLMEYVNALRERRQTNMWHSETFHSALETLMILLAPAAPHIAEELWHNTGHSGSVHRQSWPTWDEELTRDEVLTLAVQINGRLRDTIEVLVNASEEDVKEQALARTKIQQHLKGQEISQLYYVPGRILNIVTHQSH